MTFVGKRTTAYGMEVSVMIEPGDNLDVLTMDELETLSEGIPGVPSAVSTWALHTHTARGFRLSGHINAALAHEDIAESCFRRFPSAWRW